MANDYSIRGLPPIVEMASKEFRPEKFFTRKHFNPHDIQLMWRNADILDRELGSMVATLVAYVYTEELQNETVEVQAVASVDYPASWWDATKERWFPSWAKKRWPVQWKTLTATRSKSKQFKTVALLPEFEYKIPKGGGGVVVLKAVGGF